MYALSLVGLLVILISPAIVNAAAMDDHVGMGGCHDGDCIVSKVHDCERNSPPVSEVHSGHDSHNSMNDQTKRNQECNKELSNMALAYAADQAKSSRPEMSTNEWIKTHGEYDVGSQTFSINVYSPRHKQTQWVRILDKIMRATIQKEVGGKLVWLDDVDRKPFDATDALYLKMIAKRQAQEDEAEREDERSQRERDRQERRRKEEEEEMRRQSSIRFRVSKVFARLPTIQSFTSFSNKIRQMTVKNMVSSVRNLFSWPWRRNKVEPEKMPENTHNQSQEKLNGEREGQIGQNKPATPEGPPTAPVVPRAPPVVPPATSNGNINGGTNPKGKVRFAADVKPS